jgi:D-amino-acid dehydrogenase
MRRCGSRPLDRATLGWAWRWWRSCRPHVYRANRSRMHRLAQFSRERLGQLTQRAPPRLRARAGLPRPPAQRARDGDRRGRRSRPRRARRAPVVLDAAGCRAIEPGLNPATPLHAGIYSKDDEVANCREFTHLLRKEAERAGAVFRFNAHVERIARVRARRCASCRQPHDARDEALRSRDSSEWPTTQPQAGETTEPAFDAVVVCAAIESRRLLKPLGVRLPLIAVHGYSVTAPLRHDDAHLHLEPRAALMDERYKVAISRLGQRVRVAGSAEDRRRRRAPERARPGDARHGARRLVPGVTRRSAAQRWKGARPMLPDGPPVLGPSGAAGIWLNVGHGGSGWPLAVGLGAPRRRRDRRRKTPIEIDGLGIERLKR